MSDKKVKLPAKVPKGWTTALASPKSKNTVSPITESTAQELAKQLKRVADLMERQQKIDIVTGTREKIQEAIDRRKNEK